MSKRSALIQKAVELNMERLGDRVICKRCGATARSMGDVCNADLADTCEGFVTYDNGRSQALQDVGFFGKQRQ